MCKKENNLLISVLPLKWSTLRFFCSNLFCSPKKYKSFVEVLDSFLSLSLSLPRLRGYKDSKGVFTNRKVPEVPLFIMKGGVGSRLITQTTILKPADRICGTFTFCNKKIQE